MRRYEIRIAGFGGQGVVTLGKILGLAAAIYEGKNAVNTHSFGPESRGGACRSEVVISDGDIYYPRVRQADVLIVLSQSGYDAYIEDLKTGGWLIIDPLTVQHGTSKEEISVFRIPTAEIAHRLGGKRYQNMVALGAFCETTRVISRDSLEKAIRDGVPSTHLDKNLLAFRRGIDFVKGQNRRHDSEGLIDEGAFGSRKILLSGE